MSSIKKIQAALAQFHAHSSALLQNEENNKNATMELLDLVVFPLIQERNPNHYIDNYTYWKEAKQKGPTMEANRNQKWANTLTLVVNQLYQVVNSYTTPSKFNLTLSKFKKQFFQDITDKISDITTGKDMADFIEDMDNFYDEIKHEKSNVLNAFDMDDMKPTGSVKVETSSSSSSSSSFNEVKVAIKTEEEPNFKVKPQTSSSSTNKKRIRPTFIASL